MSTLKEQIMARMSVIAEDARNAIGKPVTHDERILSEQWRPSIDAFGSDYAKSLVEKQEARLKDFLK